MIEATELTIYIDDQPCTAFPGETVLAAARRAGIDIPTLCHDDRLAPAGACRSCLVEVEGQRRLQPSCAWIVSPDMKVVTHNSRIERHRQVLFSLYAADTRRDDSGLPAKSGNGNQLRQMCEQTNLLQLESIQSPREGREDHNPYVQFDPDLCILCARCTRYCDEVEAVSAISLTNRGGHTTIGTAGNRSLLDTSCELCGGCIDTCPTGAMIEKKAADVDITETESVRTTCNFCGVGCQLNLHVQDDKVVKITSPPPGETLNDGNLCVKGRFAYDFIHHPDRITEPLVRGEDGLLHPTTWEKALDTAAKGLLSVRDKHGADALGFVSSSRCTVEENYLVQKLARAAMRTNNVHQCAAT